MSWHISFALVFLLLSNGPTLGADATAAVDPPNLLIPYLTDDSVAVVLARPRSLIQDTEQQVLGDVPFLGDFPIPPSEIEHLCVFLRQGHGGELGVAIGFQFHRDIPATTLKCWLAPQAVEVAHLSAVPFYATPAEVIPDYPSRTHLAIPGQRVALVSFDKVLLDQLLRQQRGAPSTCALARQARLIDPAVNFCAMIDAGQIRQQLEAIPPFVRIEAAREVLSLPVELSLVSLEAQFGRQSNRMWVRLTSRDDLPKPRTKENWAKAFRPTIERLLAIPANAAKQRMGTEIESSIDQLLAKIKPFLGDLVVDASQDDVLLQVGHPPSFSRSLVQATEVLVLFVRSARNAARQSMQNYNFKSVLLSWMSFHNRLDRFPADIRDAAGKPLLSWRVAVLPQMGEEEEALYREFHLDEPWDSPHNKKLLAKMPGVYSSPWREDREGETRIQGVVGSGTAFGQSHGEVLDGTSLTVALVLAAKPVPWSQPADVVMGENQAESLLFRGDASPLGFLDGHTVLCRRLQDQTYHKLFKISDGEPVLESELFGPSDDWNDDLERQYHVPLTEVPALLVKLRGGDREVVREAAMKLLVSQEDFEQANRHGMASVLAAWVLYGQWNEEPPQNIDTPDGKAGLSWRVRILPFLDQEELYEQFHLDEPWDSPHNRTLVEKMPASFRDPEGKIAAGTTRIQAVLGKGTVFGDGARFNAITDGMSQTAVLVEARDAMAWTKPEDFPWQDEVGARLHVPASGLHAVGMLDGGVVGFAKLSDADYQSLFLYADGKPEKLPPAREVKLPDPTGNAILAAANELRGSKDPYIRAWGRRLLWQYGRGAGEPVEELLGTLLADSSPLARREALDIAARNASSDVRSARSWNSAGAARNASSDVVALLSSLRGGDEALVDELLFGPLQDVAADGVLPLLSSNDDRTRHRALAIIGATGDRRHLPHLTELVADPAIAPAVKAALSQIEARHPAEPRELDPDREEELSIRRRQLWDQGQQLIKEQKVEAGVASVREMLDVERELYGDAHPEVLSTLQWLSEHYNALGDVARAAEACKVRLDLLTKRDGPQHPDTLLARATFQMLSGPLQLSPEGQQRFAEAEKLEQQATRHAEAREFEPAITAVSQALEIRRGLFGADSVLLLPPLRLLRSCYFQAEQNSQAVKVAAEVVRIAAAAIGSDAPVTQGDRSELAVLTYLAGDADGGLGQLVALQQLPVDAANRDLQAQNARFLGLQLRDRGKPEQANGYLLQSLKLYDEAGQPEVAGELASALASFAESQDPTEVFSWHSESVWRYWQANPYQGMWSNYPSLANGMREAGKCHLELMLRKALADGLRQGLAEKQVGPLFFAKSLSDLAGTYVALGDFVLADRTLTECTTLLGTFRDDPFVIPMWVHRAEVASFLGDSDAAEKLLLEAARLSQREDVLFRVHASMVARRLASHHLDRGDEEQALEWVQRAIDEEPGRQAAEYQRAVATLAEIQHRMGRDVESHATIAAGTDLLVKADLKPFERVELLTAYGRLWLMMGEADKAEPLVQESLALSREHFGDESLSTCQVLGLLARVQLARADRDRAKQSALLALHQTRQIVEQSAYLLSPRQQMAFGQTMRESLDLYLSIAAAAECPDCFAEIYAWKGSALVRQRAVRRLAQQEGVRPFYEQLSAVTSRLATVARQTESLPDGGAEDDPAGQALRAQQEQARGLSDIQDLLEAQLSATRMAYMDWSSPPDVQDLVASLPKDGVLVDYFVYQRQMVTGVSSAGPTLLASVITADGKTSVHDLRDMASIEAAIREWRSDLGNSDESRRAGELLRQRLWDPIVQRLAGASTILISPDDALGQLPFHALPTQDGKRYLIEDYRLAVIAVPQLIPEWKERQPGNHQGSLLLVGDVAYDRGTPPEQPGEPGPSRALLARSLRAGTRFDPLPGAREEIEVIRQLRLELGGPGDPRQSPLVLTREQATEPAFRDACRGSAIVHVATHGYFAPPPEAKGELGIQAFHPGLLSGLAFSGANSQPDAAESDGLLTSDEIATMDLEGVELAVLSACETGLGRVAGGEGLIGIQRSFQVAGARGTVASLWQVPDQATRVLMERFYRNLWLKNMSRLDALREAQIFLLNNPAAIDHPEMVRGDVRLRPKGSPLPATAERTPPAQWAAFVLSGDWR